MLMLISVTMIAVNETNLYMHITIVGGGFGGVRAAQELANDPKNTITLISDREDFQYYPTLYSSATGHGHQESWVPLGEIFADYDNIHVYIDTIDGVDAAKKRLHGSSGAVYEYETVLFAIGVVTTYFNIPGLETYAYGIKSDAEIKRLKRRLFVDIAEHRQLDKNYIVIGAGPTGVELSAAIGTYIQRLAKYYGIKQHAINVRLIEAMPRVLPRMSMMTSGAVTKRLKHLGVQVEVNKRVERERPDALIVDGRPLESHTVIWTSGVTNHPLFAAHPDIFRLSKSGRVQVDEYLQAAPDIYVIGDNADTPYTGMAQTAIHDAVTVARNLKRLAAGQPAKPYRARRPVQAIPVGRRWAVVEWRFIRFYGWLGAVLRRMADIVGYHEVLPLGTSLGSWRAAYIYEHDYFTPSVKTKKPRR